MKKVSRKFNPARFLQYAFFMFLLTISSVWAIAQDETKKVDVDINADSGGGFFASPWVWIVGGAVFILLLVALLRGGGRKEA